MIFNNLPKKIYEEDYEFQMEMLNTISKDIRKLPSSNTFLKNNMFFVPSDDYLPNLVGEYIKDESLGLYKREDCLGKFKLWIPVYDFNDDIVGFAWYSDGSIEKELEITHIKYRMQVGTFIKNRFLNIRRETYLQAIREKYLCICDGFMDKYHLEEIGLLSTSTYGSDFSVYRSFFLSFIETLFVFMDNDEAGFKLVNQIKELEPECRIIVVKQAYGKDIDDFLKVEGNAQKLLDAIDKARKEPPICGEMTIL